jgi:ribosome-associated protein
VKSSLLAQAVARLTLEKKASDVVVMDLRGLSSVTDYFVVCSGDSDVQIRAIAEAVDDGMEEKGTGAWHKEIGSPNWMIIDFVDVVLHIFHKNTRSFYNLERLWGDAKITRVEDKPSVPPAKRIVKKKSAGTAKKKPAAKKKPSAKKKTARAAKKR